MIDISLRKKILLLFLSLIVISSITTITAVLYATQNSVEDQAQDKLRVGLKVFEQLMDIRANQLFDSAEILTADFGFKAAVLDQDQATLLSVLENHGARIDADLMMLASLNGELIASTDIESHQRRVFPFQSLIPAAEEDGGLMSVVMLNGKAYQMLMLQVNAPVPAAWAVVGFLIDQSLANQLKALTNLEVTFTGHYNKPNATHSNEQFNISTLEHNVAKGLLPPPQPESRSPKNQDGWQHLSFQNQDFLVLSSSLVKTDQYQVDAILRTSLNEAFAKFSPLKIQILSISGIALGLSVIIGFFIARNITQPVNSLVTAAERISSGNYSEDIPFGHCEHNELGQLASSFNLMQKGIAEREDKILHQVYHDTLTGLANRMSAQQTVEQLIEQYSLTPDSINTTTACFALVSLNIRQFKQINDTFGYQTGDELLKAVATTLVKLSEQHVEPARLGADEFLLILMGQDDQQLTDQIKSVIHQLQHHYQIGDLSIPVSLSAGAAIYPTHGEETDQLLRRADIALNEAKRQKQHVSFYQLGTDEKYLSQIRLVNDLKVAIEQDQLTMFYQPKVDLHLKQVTQVEALIRWFHDELGFIRPDEFIGLAEQSGLMPSLSRWVLKTVLSDAERWHALDVHLTMAVNLSAYDLAHDDLPSYVESLLTSHQLSSESLILEVTESAVMEDPEQALGVLNQFKTQGIKLAIDDYGTGYSSLSQLKMLPVDELKIDMSFVLKLDANTEDQAIVQSTIEMGHNLGLTIVAEGVENRASWALLEQFGCDKLQGYYIAKPQGSEDFIQWYKEYDINSEYPAVNG